MLQNKFPSISKTKFLSLLILGCSVSCGLFAQEESNPYEKIWDKVTLYENEDNSLVSKFWLTGRLQGEYHSFENEVAPAIDHDDYDWRRFRFGFKVTLLGDITLHSKADLGLVYYEIRINASCHLK